MTARASSSPAQIIDQNKKVAVFSPKNGTEARSLLETENTNKYNKSTKGYEKLKAVYDYE